MSELFSAPFNLAYLATISATVEALNLVGYSTPSPAGTGLTVSTPPVDAPVISRDPTTTTTTIVIAWAAITTSGGSAVTGYDISMLSGGTYSVIATVALVTTYSHTGRTSGTTYTYRVNARNAFSVAGNAGALSTPLSIIAAIAPAQLAPLSSANVLTSVVFSWLATPNANSSPVTAYRIKIKVNGVATPQYVNQTTYCDGSSYNVWANMQCTIPMSVFTVSPYFLAPNASVLA
jgi:hypothetical protein